MSRCDKCEGVGCSCCLTAGTGITITGTGEEGDCYEISADAAGAACELTPTLVAGGVVDNSAAIQAAWDNADNLPVCLPPGVYLVDADLIPPDGLTCRGGGIDPDQTGHTRVTRLLAGPNATRVIDGRGVEMVTFEHFEVDCNGLADYGIDLDHPTNGFVTRNALDHMLVGDALVWNITMDNNGEASVHDTVVNAGAAGEAFRFSDIGGDLTLERSSFCLGRTTLGFQTCVATGCRFDGLDTDTSGSGELSLVGCYCYNRTTGAVAPEVLLDTTNGGLASLQLIGGRFVIFDSTDGGFMFDGDIGHIFWAGAILDTPVGVGNPDVWAGTATLVTAEFFGGGAGALGTSGVVNWNPPSDDVSYRNFLAGPGDLRDSLVSSGPVGSSYNLDGFGTPSWFAGLLAFITSNLSGGQTEFDAIASGAAGPATEGETFRAARLKQADGLYRTDLEVLGEVAIGTNGDTVLMIRTNDAGVYALKQVFVGADDSGGVGFKMMRILN